MELLLPLLVCFKPVGLTLGCVLCHLPLPKAELPPPYTAIASPDAGGVPVINCRVCQSLINLDGKLHQHVVKCTVCNEATVSLLIRFHGTFTDIVVYVRGGRTEAQRPHVAQ